MAHLTIPWPLGSRTGTLRLCTFHCSPALEAPYGFPRGFNHQPNEELAVSIKWWYPNSWMVYFMENPIKIDDDWGTPISGDHQLSLSQTWWILEKNATFGGKVVINRILACTNSCWKWWRHRVHRSMKTEALGKALMPFWGQIQKPNWYLDLSSTFKKCGLPHSFRILEHICWIFGGSRNTFCDVFWFYLVVVQDCFRRLPFGDCGNHSSPTAIHFFPRSLCAQRSQAVLCSNVQTGCLGQVWGAENPRGLSSG